MKSCHLSEGSAHLQVFYGVDSINLKLLRGLFSLQHFKKFLNSYFFLLIGAHSHIRGLGLDDALEARQVCLFHFSDILLLASSYCTMYTCVWWPDGSSEISFLSTIKGVSDKITSSGC